MIAAVIPAYNEEDSIGHVLDALAHLFTLDTVIPVLNGCTDHTRQVVAQAVLFVDGDFRGDFSSCLQDLLCAVVHKDCDLALTNCYPYIGYRSETAKAVLYYREQLNRKLGLFSSVGLATPSHGPHCVSRRLLETVGFDCLSTPPLMLAKAAESHLNIRVAARLDDTQWTSAQRGDLHNQKIADTIIGDCIAARQYFCHQPITREENGIVYLGYRKK